MISTTELPPDVVFHPSPRLFVWKPRGSLNETAVKKIIASVAEQEAASNQPFLRFADLTALDQVELNFEFVFHVSLYRRLTYAGQHSTKAAFLVTNLEAEHYAKLHAMLTDYSPLEVAVFEDRGAAAKWLGVSPELLEMP
jgi:hypothetical protein